jgi:hypothetical protein
VPRRCTWRRCGSAERARASRPRRLREGLLGARRSRGPRRTPRRPHHLRRGGAAAHPQRAGAGRLPGRPGLCVAGGLAAGERRSGPAPAPAAARAHCRGVGGGRPEAGGHPRRRQARERFADGPLQAGPRRGEVRPTWRPADWTTAPWATHDAAVPHEVSDEKVVGVNALVRHRGRER